MPDQRGYGGSDRPEAIEAYNLVELSKDIAGPASALGHEKFTVVGHDWGAPVAWHTALLHRERVKSVVGMSAPYTRWKAGTLTRQENFGSNTWYMDYFQKPGVAEAELEADIRKSLRMIYYSISGDAPEGIWFVPKPSTAKFLDGLIDPPALLQKIVKAVGRRKLVHHRDTQQGERAPTIRAAAIQHRGEAKMMVCGL
jgi:pimeloyl-ACP methyl ester carboxylesterase